MAVVVHRQRGDAVARLDAEPLQRLRHPPRIMRRGASSWSGKVDPSARAATISRVAMLALGMIDQPHDAQRKVLHRARVSIAAIPPIAVPALLSEASVAS